MLVKVKLVDHNTDYAYTPPRVDAVINSEHVLDAKVEDGRDHRGEGPFLRLRMRDGRGLLIISSADEFFAKCTGKQESPLRAGLLRAKELFRESTDASGGCKMYSQGEACQCFLCLCDNELAKES